MQSIDRADGHVHDTDADRRSRAPCGTRRGRAISLSGARLRDAYDSGTLRWVTLSTPWTSAGTVGETSIVEQGTHPDSR